MFKETNNCKSWFCASPIAAAMFLVSVPASAATVKIAKSTVADVFAGVLNRTEIHLNSYGPLRDGRRKPSFHKANSSSVNVLGYRFAFNIPEFSHRRKRGKIRYFYNVRDVNSQAFRVTPHKNGFLFTVSFESAGSEIKGTCRWKKTRGRYTKCRPSGDDKWAPDIQWNNPTIEIYVIPRLLNGGITYDVGSVRMLGKLQMNGPLCKNFGDICNRVLKYQKTISSAVETQVRKQLGAKQLRARVARESRKQLSALGYVGAKVTSVRNGDITIQY